MQTPASPAPTPTPTPAPSGPWSAFAYVVDSAGGLVAYGVEETTGQLRSLARLPLANPRRVAAHPSGRFLYVAGDMVHAYLIDQARGTLTAIGSYSDQWVTSTSADLVVTTTGYLYNAKIAGTTGSRGAIIGYRVDGTTGALTRIGNMAGDLEPRFAVADPGELRLYSGGIMYRSDDWFLIAFAIARDGTLPEMVRRRMDVPSGGAVHPSGRALYVADGKSLVTYALDERTGVPTELARHTFPDNVGRPRPHPEGRFLCVPGSDGVRMFVANPRTGSLTLADEVLLSGGRTRRAAFGPGGGFLYLSEEREGVRIFAVDGTTGKLQEIGRVAEGDGPLALVAATPSG